MVPTNSGQVAVNRATEPHLRPGTLTVLHHRPEPYLFSLALAPIASQLGQHYGLGFTFPVLPLPNLIQLLFFAAAISFWFVYQTRAKPTRPLTWGLALLGIAWATHLILTITRQDHFAPLAAMLGPALLMIWQKPPDFIGARRTLDCFSFALVGAYLAQRALEQFGIGAIQSGIYFRTPFLFDIFGPIPKWQGPFGHVAEAAALGAFLLVYGVNRRGLPAWVFSVTGLLMLVMAEQRTAVFAAAVGIGVTLIFRKRRGSLRIPSWLLALSMLLTIGGIALLLASLGPAIVGLNGRNDIWAAFLALWATSPLVGVGQSGIEQLSDTGFIWNGVFVAGVPHGHNLTVDVLARYGVLGAVSVVALIVLVVTVGAKLAMRGLPAPLALISVMLTVSLTETNLDFRYASLGVTLFLLTFLLGTSLLTVTKAQAENNLSSYVSVQPRRPIFSPTRSGEDEQGAT